MLLLEAPVVDSSYWNFKKGIALLKLGEDDIALRCFIDCANNDIPLSSVAWEYVGDIEALLKHPMMAAHAYIFAQKDENLPVDRYPAITVKMKSLLITWPRLSDSIPLLKQLQIEITAEQKPVPVSPFRVLDSLVAGERGTALKIDSIVGIFIDTPATVNGCSLLVHMDSLHIPDSLFSTRHLFRLSQLALHCTLNRKSYLLLARAMERSDFPTVIQEKTALYHKGFVEYQNQNYIQSALLLTQYVTTYGTRADVVVTIARYIVI